MNRKANLLMVLGASLLALTAAAAYQGQPNYTVAETVRVGYSELRRTIVFDVGPNHRAFTFGFAIWHPNDVVLDMNMPGAVWQRGPINPSGGGLLYEYSLDVDPPGPGRYNQDIIVNDPNGGAIPQYRQGRGIVKALSLDPAYDYTRAKIEGRAFQEAVKHTQRYWYLNNIPINYNPRF